MLVSLWFVSWRALDFRVSLNLDQHAGINQGFYFHHRCRRHNITKEFAVRATVLFPTRDVSYKHARTHDVCEGCAKALQGLLDVPNALGGLFVRVCLRQQFRRFICRGGAGDVDAIADFDCTRVADDRFPFRAGRNTFAQSCFALH
jgi:hypothetical protein